MARSAVTKMKMKCRQCDKVLVKPKHPRQKKFCNDLCRWRFHNKERTEALKQVRAMRQRGAKPQKPAAKLQADA